MICKEFDTLPSNQDFKNLTDFQIAWIIQNIVMDAKIEEKAFKKATNGSSEQEGYDLSDEMSAEDLANIFKAKKMNENTK